MSSLDLSGVEPAVRSVLDSRFTSREQGLAESRRVIRAAANAIRSLHRRQWEEAERLVAESGEILRRVIEVLGPHPDVLHAGFVNDAAKEYAEARLSTALFRGQPLPSHADLAIDPIPYLHGLGEAVGELRRRLLDLLREAEVEAAEECLGFMDRIVDLLATLDYPDGMTGGLRRVTDVARSLVERSRADLTATVVQERLRRQLAGES